MESEREVEQVRELMNEKVANAEKVLGEQRWYCVLCSCLWRHRKKRSDVGHQLEQGSPNFFHGGGHIADILKTRRPKLTQIKLEVTVNNVGDRVMLPEK